MISWFNWLWDIIFLIVKYFWRLPQTDVEDVLVNYCLCVGNYVINQNKIENQPKETVKITQCTFTCLFLVKIFRSTLNWLPKLLNWKFKYDKSMISISLWPCFEHSELVAKEILFVAAWMMSFTRHI